MQTFFFFNIIIFRIIHLKKSPSLKVFSFLIVSLRQLRLFKEKLRGKSREKEDNKNTSFKNVKEAHPSKKKNENKPTNS